MLAPFNEIKDQFPQVSPVFFEILVLTSSFMIQIANEISCRGEYVIK